MQVAIDYQSAQSLTKRVCWIRAKKPPVTVTSTDDQTRGLELRQLVLDRVQGKEAQPRQLAPMQFLSGIRKQKAQHFRSDGREQTVEQGLSAPLGKDILTALSRQH